MGSSFIQWIQTFKSNSNAVVLRNGYLSKPLSVERGYRQGDLLFPYLFIIGGVILNTCILTHQHKNIEGITVNGTECVLAQYTEDTEFLLDGSYTSLQGALDTLKCPMYWKQESFKVFGIELSTAGVRG